VLTYLLQGLERHLLRSTLKVYVASIVANHDPGWEVLGKPKLIVRFPRDAQRLFLLGIFLWSFNPCREIWP